MEQTIADWRRSARTRLLAARGEPAQSTFASWSAAIGERLAEQMAISRPRILGVYWPHRGEYDPIPLAAAHIERGGQVALPVVVARAQPLEYRPWCPDVAMAPGKLSFGIPEPVYGPAVVPDLLLVPLLGFDGAGYRLGYGGGYFDRTLAACSTRPRSIGVGFEIGRLPSIRPLPHDIPLDVIVTEAGSF